MAIILFLIALFVTPAIGQEPNQPARISGRVVAADTGAPLRGALVELVGGAIPAPFVVTDADGRFEFLERRVGRYAVQATKAGYVPYLFGRLADQPDLFDVLAGQRIDRGTIRLSRGAVISGRVHDDAGEPVQDAMVTAWRIEYSQPGIRSLQQIKEVPTNDLGEYRIHGLMPGQYKVAAARHALPPELRTATVEMQARLAAERAGTVFAGLGLPEYSEPITVETAAGAETSDMNITLIRWRHVGVSGSVLDSGGRPMSGAVVTLRSAQSNPASPGPDAQAMTRAGQFVFTNVPVGEYRLTARTDVTTERLLAMRAAATSTLVEESVSMSIRVTEDTSNVILQTRTGPVVNGRVFIDGAPVVTTTPLRMVTLPAGQQPIVPRAATAGTLVSTYAEGARPPAGRYVGLPPPGRFVITNASGGIVLRYAGSPELSLKNVTANGVDVTDGFEVTQSDMTVDVHLTAQGPVLKGIVKDADGAFAAGRDVVLFSVEPAYWEVPLSRRVAAIRTNDEGAFQVTSLPAGQYLAVAPADLDRAMWADPERLERLRALATPFSLSDASTTKIDLVVKR